METLLPYYERELTFLRRLSHDFARSYPKVASRLLLSGETCEDPHIERLIESFAFLTGRIHKKLDDDYPELIESLLQVVYPQYLRPFPSVSVAQFDAGEAATKLTEAAYVPRRTGLNTRPVRGAPCRFKTCYDVELWPVEISQAEYENLVDTVGLRSSLVRSISAAIRVNLVSQSETAGLDKLKVGSLRVFLHGEPAVVALIREALFSKVAGIWVSTPDSSEKIEIPASSIRPVGYGENEGLLDLDVRANRAYQLMLEYFVFPEKFNFFDLDLSSLKGRLPANTRSIDIRIGLKEVSDNTFSGNLLDRLGKDNFALGCTPIINLFRQHSEPIRMTETMASYPVIIDSRKPLGYEVYDIVRVSKVTQNPDGEEVSEFKPFYSVRHGEPHDGPARFWHANYVDDEANGNYTMEISLVDTTMDPQRPESNTLSLDLICTNRDLPSQLPFGLIQGDLTVEGGAVVEKIRMLRKPTPSHRFPRGRGAQWRLISHLALNHLSLSGDGGDAIKEILALYDITRSVANNRQINGIISIESRPAMTRIAGNPFPSFVRGLEIRITVDETHYAGIGWFTFAQILDHFFGLYVHTNSFTQLIMVSKQTGQELIKCSPRNGASILA